MGEKAGFDAKVKQFLSESLGLPPLPPKGANMRNISQKISAQQVADKVMATISTDVLNAQMLQSTGDQMQFLLLENNSLKSIAAVAAAFYDDRSETQEVEDLLKADGFEQKAKEAVDLLRS